MVHQCGCLAVDLRPLPPPPRGLQLGLPVRVTRKQKDPDKVYGIHYVYDGLYNVVEYNECAHATNKMCMHWASARPGGAHLRCPGPPPPPCAPASTG